jgi:hypothetical protein
VTERSEIQFGLTRIPFLIRRSPRRTTVALTIESDGTLVVTAPPAVPAGTLNEVVHRKARWVVERRRRVSDLPPPPPERELVTGETVLYLGRHYRLKVVEGAGEPARLRGGWYEVSVPAGLPEEDRRREVRRRLAASLKERAARYIPPRLREVCRRTRTAEPAVLVREQKKRWGSCDAGGVLRINWRIVQAPIPLIEYVLVHELCHLRHREHGPAFWAEVGRRMPDYEERRARLRKLGPRLSW